MSSQDTSNAEHVEIQELAFGGDGFAKRDNGKSIFVPMTTVGDVVSVTIVEDKKDYSRGKVEQIVKAGPSRVVSACEAFNRQTCGGCAWLHIKPETQRSALESQVKRSLQRQVEGGTQIRWAKDDAEPMSLHWRRKAKIHWSKNSKTGQVRLGFYAPNTKNVSNIKQCVQLTKGLGKVFSFLQQESSVFSGLQGDVTMLEGDDGGVLLHIDGDVRVEAIDAWKDQAGIKGIVNKEHRWGKEETLVDGLSLKATSFAQASKHGNHLLRNTLKSMMASIKSKHVLELYAGSGNLTSCLEGAASIDAVEKFSSFALKDSRVSFYKKDVRKFLNTINSKDKYDCVVMDPPRKGAKDIMASLMELSFDSLVYVSCNPSTLTRDTKGLRDKGFKLKDVVLIEMSPQTAHIELVALFQRG